MNYWHLNTCNLINKNSMLTHNLGYIGLGTIHDNEYQNRIKRPGTTPCQFKLFQQKAKNGDIIFLYHNKYRNLCPRNFTSLLILEAEQV